MFVFMDSQMILIGKTLQQEVSRNSSNWECEHNKCHSTESNFYNMLNYHYCVKIQPSKADISCSLVNSTKQKYNKTQIMFIVSKYTREIAV